MKSTNFKLAVVTGLLITLTATFILHCVRIPGIQHISSTSCPCGAVYFAPYKECEVCGASSELGICRTKKECRSCGNWFDIGDTCPNCGSEYVNGSLFIPVKDLVPAVYQMYR